MDDAIQAIDREMEVLRNSLLKLAVKRNSVSPSYRLPSEILGLIFLIYKEMIIIEQNAASDDAGSRNRILRDPDNRRSDSPLPLRLIPLASYVPWTPPSQVSSRWRSVALDIAILWDVLHLNNIQWTRELLRRSKKAPLHVQIIRPTSTLLIPRPSITSQCTIVECLRITVDDAGDRISSLDLRLWSPTADSRRSESHESPLQAIFHARRFPALRHLDLATSPHRIIDSSHPEEFSCAFVRELVELEAPAAPPLASLTLSSYRANVWCNMSIQTLTNLTIYGCRDLTAIRLVEVLGRLPTLQNLEVMNSFTGNVDLDTGIMYTGDVYRSRPALNSMRRFSIAGPVAQLAIILTSFTIPLTARIYLICTCPVQSSLDTTVDQTRHLMRALDGHIRPSFSYSWKDECKSTASLNRSLLFGCGAGNVVFALSPNPISTRATNPRTIHPLPLGNRSDMSLYVFIEAQKGRRVTNLPLLAAEALETVVLDHITDILDDMEHVTFHDLGIPSRVALTEHTSLFRWFTMLRKLPNLGRLAVILGRSSHTEFFKALDPLSHDDCADPGCTAVGAPFPALGELVISQASLEELDVMGLPLHTVSQPGSQYQPTILGPIPQFQVLGGVHGPPNPGPAVMHTPNHPINNYVQYATLTHPAMISPPVVSQQTPARLLLPILETRNQEHLPKLTTLSLQNCTGVTESLVGKLKEVVNGSVVWDGV